MQQTEHASRARRLVLSWDAVFELWLCAHRLVIVGLLSIAMSGAVAWALVAAFGDAFVGGDAPGVTYTAARCRDFAEYAPRDSTCEEAAAAHHAGEVVEYRVALAVLALLAAGGYAAIRRARPRRRRLTPRSLEPAVGATAFGLAGLGLLALGMSQLALGLGAGAGRYLSGAIVALPVAVLYAARLYRALVEHERSVRGTSNEPVV